MKTRKADFIPFRKKDPAPVPAICSKQSINTPSFHIHNIEKKTSFSINKTYSYPQKNRHDRGGDALHVNYPQISDKK